MKSFKFKAVFAILFALIFLSRQLFAMDLYPIRNPDTDKAGYMNKGGELIIEARYERAGYFYEGLAPVSILGRYFFINKKGDKVFKQTFADAKIFSEGLAAVRNDEGWGYINTRGDIVVPCTFSWADDFSEGLACVMTGKYEDKSARYSYINKEGKVVIEPFLKFYDNQYFTAPGKFSEGLAAAWMPNGLGFEVAGYINREGKVIIEPEYISAGKFVNNLAPAAIPGSKAGGAGFINKKNNCVIDFVYSMTQEFSEGLAAVELSYDDKREGAGKWGYINTEEKLVVQPEYELAEPFYKGLGKVYLDTVGNEAYVNKKGELIKLNTETKPRKQQNKELLPVKISCSSFLPAAANGRITYNTDNLIDNDPSTAWIEGSPGDGEGEWVCFEFAEPKHIKQIKIRNGYQKISSSGKNIYYSNLRPGTIKISTNSNQQKIVKLKDSEGSQSIDLDAKATSLKITIIDVHKTGNEDPDAGFSEIMLLGY
ncbi:MAG: WG repeat-containing protein [Candidatus Rifleibacteriota bacterium]